MTLVQSSYTYTTSQAWQSVTPVATDPSERVNTELQNWINAIPGTPLRLFKKPSDATTKGGASVVQWFIAENTPQADFYGVGSPVVRGVNFMPRLGNATQTAQTTFSFNSHYNSTSNNGYGTYTTGASSVGSVTPVNMTVTSPVINTVYEADVALPWFVCWQGQGTGFFSGIFMLDQTALTGDPRNSDGTRARYMVIHAESTSQHAIVDLYRSSTNTPQYTVNFSNSRTNRGQFWQFPIDNQAFFGPCPGRGWSGYVGMPDKDSYVTSTSTTGALLDTCTIGGKTYTKATSRFWVRTA